MKQLDFLNNNEKYILAQCIKRMTWDDVHRWVPQGSKEQEKEDTYRYLDVFIKLEDELKSQGYAPR